MVNTTYDGCTKEERETVHTARDQHYSLLKAAVEKKQNLVAYSPACLFHCYYLFQVMDPNVQQVKIKGQTVDEAFLDFMAGKNTQQFIDEVRWPDNVPCSCHNPEILL